MTSLVFLALFAGQSGPQWDREAVLGSFADDRPLGRVEIFLKLLPSGGIRRKTICTFFTDSGKAYITDEEEWDGQGLMTSASRRTRTGADSGLVKASFSEDRAVLSFIRGTEGKPREEVLELPAGAKRGETSLLWLTGKKPSVGEKSRETRFDFDRMAWTDVEVTFVGSGKLSLRGKEIPCWEISDSLGVRQWVDSHGLLVRQEATDESGRIVWDRISAQVRR